MKAKLIKLENGEYDLLVDTNLKNLADTKLSLKKCQAIERGYDLDELANKEYLDGYDSTKFCRLAFKDGFQKALELMGDKKFSAEDMEFMFACGRNYQASADTDCHFTNVIQTLQQTEWDVEIEMEWKPKLTRCDECGEGGYYMDTPCDHANDCKHWSPKLDENGCLILKLKSE